MSLPAKPNYAHLRQVLENIGRYPDPSHPEAVWVVYQDGPFVRRVRRPIAFSDQWSITLWAEPGQSWPRVQFSALLRLQSALDGDREWSRSSDSPRVRGVKGRIRRAIFALAGQGRYRGYARGDGWNGRIYPLLPKAEVERLVAACNSGTSGLPREGYYDASCDAFWFLSDPRDLETMEVCHGVDVDVRGTLMRLYPVGIGRWTWQETSTAGRRVVAAV